MGELARLAHIKKLDAAEVGRKPVGTPGQKGALIEETVLSVLICC